MFIEKRSQNRITILPVFQNSPKIFFPLCATQWANETCSEGGTFKSAGLGVLGD